MRSKKVKIAKLLAISLGAIGLAVIAGLQTASLVLERTAPELALQLNSKNGKAMGRKAFQDFSSQVAEGAVPQKAARNVADLARQALRHEPLLPQAHAILALAADSPQERKVILEQALKLNRRSATLLGISLQEEIADEDVAEVIATLDQILRVHPETSAEFFPVLAGALAEDQSLPVFERVLVSKPPWQDSFLSSAITNPAAVVNAAELRRRVIIESENLDAVLVARLAAAGELEAAKEHYAFLEKRFPRSTNSALRSDYPPIDWKLTDSREKRAQLSRDGDAIEIFVRAGAGGILMERIASSDRPAMAVTIDHQIEPAAQLKNVRLQARCAGSNQALLDQSFEDQANRVRITVPSGDCEFVKLAIYARVPAVSPALRGSISAFSIQ